MCQRKLLGFDGVTGLEAELNVFLNIGQYSIPASCDRYRSLIFFFFQAEDGIRDIGVTGVQTCALPILGYHLFRDVDPQHWSSFPISAMTLFQIITLEGWVDVMEPVILNLGPLYWLYFASFILIGTFIVINLFISVIVRKSEEAYQQVQRESQIPLMQQEIIEEIREIHRILRQIEERIGTEDKGNKEQK